MPITQILLTQNSAGGGGGGGGTPQPGILATSLEFNTAIDRVGYAADADWVLGTSDFTVEWFQWQTDNSGPQRSFSVGRWNTSPFSLELSVGGGLLWRNASYISYINSYGGATLLNQWNHYAISRNYTLGLIAMWINGERVITDTDSLDYGGGGLPLTIGHEDINQNGEFKGYITNFHWVKGASKYDVTSAVITPPTGPITALPESKLLLNVSSQIGAFTDSSPAGKTFNVVNVGWSPYGPF
jgi:hypothetical protein